MNMVSEQGQTQIAKETQNPRGIVSQNLEEGGSWQNESSNLVFLVAGLCKIHKEKRSSFGFPDGSMGEESVCYAGDTGYVVG